MGGRTTRVCVHSLWARVQGAVSALALALALALAAGAWAAPAMHRTGPTPEWVELIVPEDVAPPPEQVADGKQYLLIDTQARVDGADKVHFRHVAVKALNERGVEQVANIELSFDPSYQTLTLHAINLRRDGRVIGKLAGARVKVLQREAGLESLIYDGSRTAHVFLEDVRVGDVVEYAYSLRGHNPVFGGRHFSGFDLQYTVPVARLHARLLWPVDRPIHWRHHNAAPHATVLQKGSHQAYTWDLRSVAGRTIESDAPSWFDPYPGVQWSEFADWKAVTDWALPLYRRKEPGRAVQAVVSSLASRHADPASRLVAALQYVQSEVRYLGIEVGPGSHAPNPPDLVLERRYGDCKDKTLLLMTLLHGLGVEAVPALVNTNLRHGIASHQPSPGAFNHVLVRARVAGQDYWLDPTRSPQKGSLAQIAQADYGRALVVDPVTRELSPMAGERSRLQQRAVRVTLDATDGVGKPARYTVATTTHGAAADSMRASLASQSRESMQKQYLNFYTGYFGSAAVAAPFVVEDDPQANRLTVTEHYVLNEFWKHSKEKARTDGQIEVPDLGEYLRQPRSVVRNAPLSLTHPSQLELVTEVRLPESWHIEPETAQVDDDAFRFRRKVEWNAKLRHITFTDHYESLVDHVAPDDLARYAGNLEKARVGSSYVVYKPDATASAIGGGNVLHWLPAIAGTLAVVGWMWAARRLYGWNPAPYLGLSAQALPPAPRRIGGWLLLPAIGLPIHIARSSIELANVWPWLSTQAWFDISDPAGRFYHPAVAPVVLFELVAGLGLVALAVVALVLFYQRRSSLPAVYIALLAAAVSVQWLDLIARAATPLDSLMVGSEEWWSATRDLLLAAVWITYFRQSERVRQTFVWPLKHRRARPVAMPAAGMA